MNKFILFPHGHKYIHKNQIVHKMYKHEHNHTENNHVHKHEGGRIHHGTGKKLSHYNLNSK